MRFLTRLRYQLILSHFVAIAFTLLSMVAALVFVAAGWLSSQQDPLAGPGRTRARLRVPSAGSSERAGARRSSTPCSRPWRAETSGAQALLRSGDGEDEVVLLAWIHLAERRLHRRRGAGRDADRELRPGGRRLRPAGAVGMGCGCPGRARRPADPGQLVLARPGKEPAALGAYPIIDAADRPVAAVVVASRHRRLKASHDRARARAGLRRGRLARRPGARLALRRDPGERRRIRPLAPAGRAAREAGSGGRAARRGRPDPAVSRRARPTRSDSSPGASTTWRPSSPRRSPSSKPRRRPRRRRSAPSVSWWSTCPTSSEPRSP